MKALGMFAVLIVALAVTGVAVAHWSDYVYIKGTIHMGELVVGIENNSLSWVETINGVPEMEFNPPKENKWWVANATVTLSDFETSEHHEPPQTVAHKMTIDITNAYPQWDLHIYFDLKNAGNIPAVYKRLVDLSAYDNTDNVDLVWREDNWYYDGENWIWEGALCDPGLPENENEIMNVKAIAKVPEDGQLEPCNAYPVSIHLDFKQTAEQCHQYLFSAKFEFVQWNEAVCEG